MGTFDTAKVKNKVSNQNVVSHVCDIDDLPFNDEADWSEMPVFAINADESKVSHAFALGFESFM